MQPHPIFPFAMADARPLNLADAPCDVADLDAFTAFLAARRGNAPALVGGYAEERRIYAASSLFDGDDEPRTLHLGVDVWTEAGTPLRTPLDAEVHSLAINGAFGDYGGTVILRHGDLHVLYGHLAHAPLADLHPGRRLAAGTVFAALGSPAENGGWPPHLHVQCIADPGDHRGDYPGVAPVSERDRWLRACPDPSFLLV